MTAEQVLGIASTLLESAREPAAPPPAAPPAPAFGVADDEYVSGAQLKTILERVVQPGASAVELAASGNLGFVRSKYAQDFTKYGGELNALIERVPAHLRTLDNLEQVVRMVRSDHLDEIAQERASQIVAGMEPTLRSNGAATPLAPVSREHSLNAETIPAEWRERAIKNGVTEEVVREFCRANDWTEAKFYEQFKTPMNRIVEDIPNKRTG